MSRFIDPSEEQKWITGVRAGDLDAFRQLFEVYSPRLQRFARVWLPRDAAEDLVQDVLFRIWERRGELNLETGKLTGYLFSAVRNRVANYLQREGVARRIEDEESARAFLSESTSSRADTDVAVQDFEIALKNGIKNLPEGQRAVLMLRWTQGLSFAEIATALSISQNAAMLLASRGRKALLPLLELYVRV